MIHADEACLGNGQEPPNPGGAGGLVEMLVGTEEDGRADAHPIVRSDYYLCEPDTTNNRMALRSAIEALRLLGARDSRLPAHGSRQSLEFVSDSNYLVLGMTEWVPAWRARGWRRKGGQVENLDLWQELVALAEGHEVRWRWVRGHAGHPENEYANHLATRAAAQQLASHGLIDSRFEEWLAQERERGRYRDYDPDQELSGQRSAR